MELRGCRDRPWLHQVWMTSSPKRDVQTRNLHHPTQSLLKGYFMLWNLYSFLGKFTTKLMWCPQWVSKRCLPFNLISGHLNCVSVLSEPQDSQSYYLHWKCDSANKSSHVSQILPQHCLQEHFLLLHPTHELGKWFFPFCLQPNIFHSHILMWSLLSAKQAAPTLQKCERVHSGHPSLSSLRSGSLPLRFFPGPIWLHPFCLLHGPTSPVFQATVLIADNQVFSTYFQSHLLRCGNFPNILLYILLPPLQSLNTPNCCLRVLCSTSRPHTRNLIPQISPASAHWDKLSN